MINYDLLGWVAPEDRDYSTAKSHADILSYSRLFSAAGSEIRDTGKGKIALLYVPHEKAFGGKAPDQIQGIGSCVAHGTGKVIQTLRAVQSDKGQIESRLNLLYATEWSYGTSRVLVGGGRLRNKDGSLGSWMQEALKLHGNLFRLVYTVNGKTYDLSHYSADREKDYGYHGLPTELEPQADEHPVLDTALVTSYEQARDSLSNGYPIAVCSNMLYSDKRDQDGFSKPTEKGGHCMAITAVDDEYRRPGCLIDNRSWGSGWNSGPKRHNQPDGTFWADAENVDKMLRQEDSYAYSNFKGFRRQDGLSYLLW